MQKFEPPFRGAENGEMAQPRGGIHKTVGVWNIVDVTTEQGCREAVARCAAAPIVPLDTETYDWKNDAGKGPSPETVGKLGLLQLGLPDSKVAYIVDIVELEGKGVDWRAIVRPLIESPTPLKIAHFAPFERAVFEGCGLRFEAGVVDTLALAGALWGDLQALHPELKSKSLKSLAYHLLGKDISKAEQGSDWSARPLTPEQRAYAALDVEIASELYTVLSRLAATAGVDPSTVEWFNRRARD